jgi:hypothetical protein
MVCEFHSRFDSVVFDKFAVHSGRQRPPLWSSGQSSCLQIQRSGFDSRRYQIFWEVVALERSPLSLVSTNDDLLDRKVVATVIENREYGRRDPSRWPRGTLYPQKLAITSPISGGRSVGIVSSRTQTMELVKLIWDGCPLIEVRHDTVGVTLPSPEDKNRSS